MYSDKQIKTIIELLNGLTVIGVENAKRVAMIATILENPEKEEEDGNT